MDAELSKELQLGRYLYDAQVLHADVVAGTTIDPERIKEVCERYCKLINVVGMVRGEIFDLERKNERLVKLIKEFEFDVKREISKE